MPRGGKREGSGRKKGSKIVNERVKTRGVQLTDAQYDKFKQLGASKWLRDQLQ